MQPASRTPSSILRKRINKENEDATGRLNKRNRLANRRVSFAPDDELETKHIFKEDFDRNSTGDLDPARAAVAPLGVTAPLAANAQAHGHMAGEPHGVMCSPDYLSPLSMDLTNNSFEAPVAAATTEPPGAKPTGEGGSVPAPLLQHPGHHHAPYGRMDITMKIPNLSTLVEEDEEECCAGDVSSRLGTEADASVSLHPAVLNGVGATEYLPSESPFSPNSIREMELCRDEETRVDQESAPLQEFWGFAPGKDDTLEVNYRHVVMGDKTYNHVYGTATSTGDITRTMGAGGLPFGLGQPAAMNRLLPTGGLPRDTEVPAGVRSPVHARPEDRMPATGVAPAAAAARGTAGGAMLPGHAATTAAPAPDQGPPMAAGAVQARPAGARDPPQHTELSAVQPQPLRPLTVPPELAPRPLQTRVQIPHSTPFLDNTTRLLEDDHTDAWRMPGAYDRGRLSVASNRVGPPGYRRGAGVGAAGDTTMLLGPTMTLASGGNANPNTVQLLADTTNHRGTYERFLQDEEERQDSPPAALPPRAATVRRPDGLPPASSVAADQRVNAYMSRNMSLELKMGGGDLLEDGALSLDAFQLPPEPTMALSQLEGDARQRQGPGAAGEAAHSTAVVLPAGRAGGAQAAAPAVARGPPPRLSYQEFLNLIDLSFIDKICRDTYEHGSDPPPKTVAEVYEAATLTTAYVETYHTASLDLSTRLANMATRMCKMEAELTANRQDLFAAVKMLPLAELEMVKEQFASLKELCRLRTVKLIKETQIAAMETYLAQLGTRKPQLQADMEAITASFTRLDICSQEASAIPSKLTRMRQEDEGQLQEAVQRKRTMEAQLQRLQALRAQNAERQRRLDQAMAEQQAKAQARGSMKPLLDERDELEARAASLSKRLNTNAMTPGREGQLIRQAALKSDTVDTLLGLHGLRLDITDMEHTGTFKLLFRRTYLIVCTAMDGVMKITVRCHDLAAAGLNDLAPSILENLQSSAAALSCSIPRAQLQQRMEHILEQLQRMSRVVEQLESCWLKFQCMQKPYVEPVATTAAVAQEGRDSEPLLVLRFINADTTTAVTIRMPWSAVLRCDYVKPQLRVQLTSLDPPETQRQYCDALQETVLSKLEPSTKYLSAVCYAMSETLQVPGGGP